MIFQRGNAMDYERWARDPGMETWDYAHCLPYFKRMETCLAADIRRPVPRPRRPARARARPGDEPAVRRVLRGRPAGRLPAHGRRQRLPAGGLRAVRPQHPQRPAAVRGARLPAPGHGPPEPRGQDARVRRRGSCSRARARSASSTRRGAARRRDGRAPARSILCGGAINSPQLLQLSGVGNAARARGARHRRRRTTCPASARTSRTTSRSTSSTRRKQPVSVAPALKWRNRPKVGARVAAAPQRARARRTTSRPAASCAATRTSSGRT